MSDLEQPGHASPVKIDADVSQSALERIRRFNPSFTLAFLKNSTDSVSLLSVDGLIEYMNPSGLAMLGFERGDEIAGLRWDMLWPKDTRGKVLAAIKEAAQGKTARYSSTLGYLNAPEMRSAITLTPLTSPLGEVDALLAVIRAQ